MKRAEVSSQYKWNLGDIYKSTNDWENSLKQISSEIKNILKFKGVLNNKATVLECFRFTDTINIELEKIYCYAMLLKDLDGTDNSASELQSRAMSLLVEYNSLASFVTPELSSLDESVLKKFINDKDFYDYEYQLTELLKNKKHILSENEEKILAEAGKTLSAFSNIYSYLGNIELPLPTLDIDGKKQKMTHGLYSLWLQHADQKVREKAFKGMYGAIESLIHTIGANYSASVNKDNFTAKIRGYNSALEKSLNSNDVPKGVYDALVQSVNKNFEPLHDYIGLRKQLLKVDTLNMYDLYVPMFEQADISCDYEKAYEMVLEGLQPMGQEYLNLLKQAKESNWIDVEETENKRSGAYSCGVYGVHPYILLNYKPTTHDIFTIAHEMGHALHTYYSQKNQPYSKSDYVIFVAEVASTVNEVLLLKHLLKTTQDKNIKKYLLSYYLDMFRTTLFRQTMFAEFEQVIHDQEQNGVPLTADNLNKEYLTLNKKYYGKNVNHNEEIRLEWARIPHFYRAFYVYQYSTGIVSAINIANDILKNGSVAVDRYKQFLSAGGSKSPYEILKDTGVDLQDSRPYDVAFNEFSDTLKQLKELCK